MIYTNSKVDIAINDSIMGRVAGSRERKPGTTGVLRAIPNHRYEFKHWLDINGNII